MKTLIAVEELMLAAFAFFLFLPLGFAWWWFFALLLAPDLGAIGYVLGPAPGAWSYNFTHHKGVGVAAFVLGAISAVPWLEAAGLIVIGHSSLDRALGYGLKYADSFQHTHLGWIGPARRA